MSLPQLFVVVSTGQRVANLPPILERAAQGDRVLWVESPTARKQKWSAGARCVLAKYGLHNEPDDVLVEQINDPVQVAQACRAAWEQRYQGQHIRPVLVANGGQKLTPIGLLRAWQDLRPVLLYGYTEPAQLWTFEAGLDRPPLIAPYLRHGLDLDDVLTASGHALSPHRPPVPLWRAAETPKPPPAEAYGVDPEYTGRLHAEHHAWAAVTATESFTTFERARAVLSEQRLEKWRRAFASLVQTGNVKHDAIMTGIYNATARLLQDAACADAQARQGVVRPTATLGDAFERTVGCRVVQWATSHGSRLVQSVWANVVVTPAQRPEATLAELDVVLVLKNGILVHLECKTATVELKDLDARLLNLQRAGSQLARMAVCAPLYTAFTAEPWFMELHRLRQRLEATGRRAFLSLTLPSQPEGYSLLDAEGVSQCYDVPSFERGLSELLAPYNPSPGSL